MGIQLVIFELDGKEYGIDVSAINGILRARKFNIQTLPGTDKSLEGMINLRGNISYIFNLRTKFEINEKAISEESKFIMLNANNSTVGCIVDEVTDIVKLNDEQVQATPDFICGNGDNYIIGIGKIEDRMIIILSPEKLFAKELATLQDSVTN
ncbi:chemotaxis protein CheW [Desulfosporosinus meridiei]|uniref:Chemotaxis signal transduction protein n=1 Tax=Desulfosporosinus meridiei (strain ATCC BAA-275 / DSM 13257 / KCTC 12902 / NCIMB 13706 / S10) TaxID=768704 RepID=J7J3L8_DESMD|nr:chemotaxis protein CheW [Desulfosporosinus meridiei]AFQ45858.1 chemotaxis signal transduction protein [Desulfosporosinus meridiei DSM 13257]